MSVWKSRSGKYTAKFALQSRQYKKEGFATRAAALAWQEAKKRQLLASPTQTATASLTDLANRYLDYCKSRMQHNTYRSKRHYLSQLISFVSQPELTRLHLLDHLDLIKTDSGPKTTNRHLRDIKAMFNWCIQHDLCQDNPAKNVKPFPEERDIRYVPPAEDIDKVLMCAGQNDMDLLIALYHTGGRIGELFRLSWDDVNFEKRAIRLWTRKRKSGELEPDQLAMSDTLLQVMRRRWDTRDKESALVFPFSYGSKRNLMRDLCRRAKVRQFGFHAIRHHVASILADSGKATLGQIQRFLRHRRQATTEGYLHELGRDQREVAEILERTGKRTTLAPESDSYRSVPLDRD
jgi:integrase